MNTIEIIKSSICKGEAAAISSRTLQAIAGINERELRKIIETLRRQGCVIASSSKGYYIPQTLDELDRFITKETKRAKSVLFTLKAANCYRAELALKAEFMPDDILYEGEGVKNG